MASRPGVNLRTYLERIIGNAGHSLWPRLLQNLRASCATDWVEKYPSHVVAKWLGHSPKVAAQHYLMSRDHHFEDVVGGGEASPSVGADGGQGSQSECDAKCASIATRNATPQASALSSTEPHKTTEPAATIQVAAGSSKRAPVTKTDPRQDAAQEEARRGHGWPGGRKGGRMPPEKQQARAKDGRACVKWRGQEPNKRGFIREIEGSRPAATRNATRFRLIPSSCSPGQWFSWRE